jgi:hypothetical protein
MIDQILRCVSPERLGHDLYYLCRDPLPFRKVNYARPGQHQNSLAEADAYIRAELERAGCQVQLTTHQVQPFRCDRTKPLHHWYSSPAADDPRFDVANLEVTFPGHAHPEQIIQLLSHKDSMSWIDSPGAHDNATGTVANLEIARILSGCRLRRSVRILFCNEEHTPWTSRFAADAARDKGDQISAVINVDGLDGKSEQDMAAARMMHAIGYSTDEGRGLAEFTRECCDRHGIGLDVTVAPKGHVNDDDGMFIKAGFGAAVHHIGSLPYGDEQYHLVGDVAQRVNIENLARSTQLVLASVLELDQRGPGALAGG